MKISLPSFTVVVLAAVLSHAQAPAAPDAGDDVRREQAAGADELLKRASDAIAAHSSIAARIRYRVDLYGHHMVGAGSYLQEGSGDGRRMRLELKTPVADRVGTMQMVCDGKFLWQLNDLGEKTSLTRVDVRRVRQELAQATGADPNALTTLAVGGLPQLVESLRQSFEFTRVEAGQLDVLPVWIVSGTWRPAALAALQKEANSKAGAAKSTSAKKSPSRLPDHVVIHLGQEDLFPYRVEYLRRPAEQGRGVGDVPEPQPIVVAEFFEARFDAPVDSAQFVYEPGSAEIVDATETFIKSLATGKK